MSPRRENLIHYFQRNSCGKRTALILTHNKLVFLLCPKSKRVRQQSQAHSIVFIRIACSLAILYHKSKSSQSQTPTFYVAKQRFQKYVLFKTSKENKILYYSIRERQCHKCEKVKLELLHTSQFYDGQSRKVRNCFRKNKTKTKLHPNLKKNRQSNINFK